MLSRTLLAVCLAFAAVPDVAPNPVPRAGETLSPRAATPVEMTAETVRIWLQEDTAKIEAVFTLANTGATKEELEVGFPTAAQPKHYTWSSKDGMNVTEWGPATISEFTAKVDGQDVKAAPKTGTAKNAHQGWLCWPIGFDPGQRRTVEVRYSVNTRDDNYSEPSALLNRQVTYILKTGAGWKGNIGLATIILHLEGMSAENILRTAPEGAAKEKGSWTWTMKDFEPDADILIQYRVFASAAEAVEKLGKRLKVNGADVEGWINYADNLVACERPLEAAEAFAKLHELEKQERNPLFRARTEYQPPAYRAAACYRQAGKKELAREWAKKAVERLQDVGAKTHEMMIRKWLRTSKEAIEARIKECRAWAEE